MPLAVAVRPLAPAAPRAFDHGASPPPCTPPDIEQRLLGAVTRSVAASEGAALPDRLDAVCAVVRALVEEARAAAASSGGGDAASAAAAAVALGQRVLHAVITGAAPAGGAGGEPALVTTACTLLAALSQAASLEARTGEQLARLVAAHSELAARFQALQRAAARRHERVHAPCVHHADKLARRLAQERREVAALQAALALARANERAAEAEAAAAAAAAAHVLDGDRDSGGGGRSGRHGAARCWDQLARARRGEPRLRGGGRSRGAGTGSPSGHQGGERSHRELSPPLLDSEADAAVGVAADLAVLAATVADADASPVAAPAAATAAAPRARAAASGSGSAGRRGRPTTSTTRSYSTGADRGVGGAGARQAGPEIDAAAPVVQAAAGAAQGGHEHGLSQELAEAEDILGQLDGLLAVCASTSSTSK